MQHLRVYICRDRRKKFKVFLRSGSKLFSVAEPIPRKDPRLQARTLSTLVNTIHTVMVKAKPDPWLLGLKVWFEQLTCLADSDSKKGLCCQHLQSGHCGQHYHSRYYFPSHPTFPLLYRLRVKMLKSVQALEFDSLLLKRTQIFTIGDFLHLLQGGFLQKSTKQAAVSLASGFTLSIAGALLSAWLPFSEGCMACLPSPGS